VRTKRRKEEAGEKKEREKEIDERKMNQLPEKQKREREIRSV
jgi:hypothetical protein